jgi:non-ribosomal peptide synthetase component E (peptide arylation enzyme)
VALAEDGAWSYRELDKQVHEIARQLSSLGIRAADRMMIVSENCIALAALLFAASRLEAWAIVANPAFRRARSTRFAITVARAACFSRPPSQRKLPRTVRALARRCAGLVHSARLASAA